MIPLPLNISTPQHLNTSTFFTGKPKVDGLGYAFLMRNYRANLAKWQTADPLGYPDDWNQLAYCGNGVTGAVDLWGCEIVVLDEVMWNGLHIATVWAECNHDYNNPSFSVTQGRLKDNPKQEVDGFPDYCYDSSPVSVNNDTYTVSVSFEKTPDVKYDYKSDPFNLMVKWEYQIKLTITKSWKKSTTISDPKDPTKSIVVSIPKMTTWVERQKVVLGQHPIEE